MSFYHLLLAAMAGYIVFLHLHYRSLIRQIIAGQLSETVHDFRLFQERPRKQKKAAGEDQAPKAPAAAGRFGG